MTGPDFIIIGAMKAATSTLHEQLAAQPGIFMTTPKEPNFFSDPAVYRRGLAWYQSLFAGARPGDLRGESSTHYTKLPDHPGVVPRLRAAYPGVRLVYLMRHPIDRLISQYIHEWTQREVRGTIDEAVERCPRLTDYSRYAMQLRPWIEAFGRDAVLPVFAERLRRHPQAEFERVCGFIGYRGSPRWNERLAEENRSDQRLRRSRVRDAVVNAPGLATLRRTLVPKTARDYVKGLWQLRERPELSPACRARLTEIFDNDLAELGRWIGVPLACGNFTETVRERPLNWAAEAPR